MKTICLALALLSTLWCSPDGAVAASDISGGRQSVDIQSQLVVPDSTQIQMITTVDGSQNIGRIVRIGDETIDFKTDFGMVTFQISQIQSIKTLAASAKKEGGLWFPNPNTTRLFFAPTGRTLQKGKGYFSDYFVFFPGFAFGFSDRFTLGGGVSLFPGLSIDKQLYHISPKFGLVQNESLQLAAGALIIRVPSDEDFRDDDPTSIGILYGVGTVGKPDASLTFGLGFGYEGTNLADRPMVMFGGEKRLTRRTAFVSENWIFPGVDGLLVSGGLRFMGERLSVDLALVKGLGEGDNGPVFPYIDFVVNF